MAFLRRFSIGDCQTTGHSDFNCQHGRKLSCEHLEDRRLLAVVTVNTDQDVVDFDDGLTSLREAIFATNTVPGPDEIVFDFGHDGPATILLTQGELAITDSLTISGPGAELLTIDASGNDPTPDSTRMDDEPGDSGDGTQIFNINDDNDTLIDVTIQNITLTGGDSGAGVNAGGAIGSRENVTLFSSVIKLNSSGLGGAINLSNDNPNPEYWPTLTIDESKLTNNESLSGGAIRAKWGHVFIYDSEISNNFARDYAGAISAVAGDLSLQNSVVDNNSASIVGGGIDFLGDTFEVIGSTISNNVLREGRATNQAGGGIYFAGNQLLIRNSSITGNVIPSQFGSHSRSGGGGIFAFSQSGISIIGSTISGNQTHSKYAKGGGAVFVRSPVAITYSTIEGNSTTGDFASGGGIYAASESLTISNTTISNNYTSGFKADGGAIAGGREVAILDSLINNNATLGEESDGGGIRLVGVNRHTISNTKISGNSSAGSGGGLAMQINPPRPPTPTHTQYSPGIFNSTFSNNHADVSGGGIAFTGTVAVPFVNSTVSGNTANNNGGGIYFDTTDEPWVISHSTIARNRSDEDRTNAGSGGGVFVRAGDVEFNHSLVAQNNDRTEVGPQVAGFIGSSISARYSLISNNKGSGFTEAPVGAPDENGNLVGGITHGTINPLLGILTNNGGPTLTHALVEGSPAIDAGDPAIIQGVDGVPHFDQRGVPFSRIYGDRIDIGAYEIQPKREIRLGDFDADNDIDGADFLAWQRGYGRLAVTVPMYVNPTGDGVVGQVDLHDWQAAFGTDEIKAPPANLTATTVNDYQSTNTDNYTELIDAAIALSSTHEPPSDEPLFNETTSLLNDSEFYWYSPATNSTSTTSAIIADIPAVEEDEQLMQDAPWLSDELLESVFG